MRKTKLSDSELRLLLVFLAVLMFAGAYFLSFQKNVSLAQEIEAQNDEDRDFVELLESMVARRAQIEAQTEEYHQVIEDIVAKYPADVPEEKAITIIQEIEDRTGASVDNISFTMGTLIATLDGAAVTEYAEDTEGQNMLSAEPSIGYRDTLSMRYEAGYSDFKRMIDYINGLSDRMTIPSITAAYDNGTGNISGMITVNMFYLTNTGREYEVPGITGISKGLRDIFRSGGGTSTTPTTSAEAEVEENDEENGEENEEEQEENE